MGTAQRMGVHTRKSSLHSYAANAADRVFVQDPTKTAYST